VGGCTCGDGETAELAEPAVWVNSRLVGMTAPTVDLMDYADVVDRFEPVLGMEVHVELGTATKMFCGCPTEFGAEPNTQVCPVCLGLPGSLPVVNEKAVESAIRIGLALNCSIAPWGRFARKNYFYPDQPKNYQISQYDEPIAVNGHLDVMLDDGSTFRVEIERAHMEEDTGKSLHVGGATGRIHGASHSLLDYNRAGVPLIEIVSEPDMRGSPEAEAYLRALRSILEYAAVSDVSMEEGSLRVDANISTRPVGQTTLGTKTELKNLNSFSNVARALEAEFARQCILIDSGGSVQQQTMLWDERASEVRPARSKEGSHDYRYFPDPDLPPLILALERTDEIQRSIPELPRARRARFRAEYAELTPYDVAVLTANPATGEYFEQSARQSGNAKAAANWIMGEVLAALKDTGEGIAQFRVRPGELSELIRLVDDGVVSHSAAKQIFGTMVGTGDRPSHIAERQGLLKVTDDAALSGWIDAVIAEHPDEAQRFVAGEKRLLGVLVGYVMKKSKGSADPKRINQLLLARAGA
jgi:aspartyl-tRNA(Asn)/glutamyl-tRNA(Gln) amidotransferase subunit B